MPPYWNRRRNWRKPYRRRGWFLRRRTRKTFRPRTWRRKYYRRRRRYWVRRRRFPKKLKTILLKQFQPETIRRCNIIGTIPLFQGSPERANNNYVQYLYSYVPKEEPGGGGWSLMVESLGSLWEDFEHLKNIWTHTNYGLPLARYGGVTLTFYQSPYTDYIVTVTNCYPMTDTKYKHADSAPNRMLQKRKAIRVPSLETRRKKRPYKKIRVRPPSQMQNKWYFQKDICDIPLIMITATAVDFRYPFAPSAAKSNNLTLTCLNTTFWQFHDFDEPPGTTGYIPKPDIYMYVNGENTSKPNKVTQLIYLGDTKNYTAGKKGDVKKTENWGNPFWHHYLDDSETIYISTKPPTTIQDSDLNTATTFYPLNEELFFETRYNPEKDKGEANKIFLVNNFQRGGYDPPVSENLQMSGFPLYDMCWGAIDWWKKLHEATDIDNHWLFCIITDQFDVKKPVYIPIDIYFRQGFGPYEAPITNYDRKHWNPKSRFQTKSINDICLTGPGCTRPPYNNYIQAKLKYNFHFKWGGCPQTLEKPYDPCSQPNWIIPSNLTERLQIENPNTPPETTLQKWDWRRDYVKQTAIQRIQKHTKTDETLQISTGSRRDPQVLRETQETSEPETEEETQIPIQTQLQQLRQQQRELKHRILQRLIQQPIKF